MIPFLILLMPVLSLIGMAPLWWTVKSYAKASSAARRRRESLEMIGEGTRGSQSTFPHETNLGSVFVAIYTALTACVFLHLIVYAIFEVWLRPADIFSFYESQFWSTQITTILDFFLIAAVLKGILGIPKYGTAMLVTLVATIWLILMLIIIYAFMYCFFVFGPLR